MESAIVLGVGLLIGIAVGWALGRLALRPLSRRLQSLESAHHQSEAERHAALARAERLDQALIDEKAHAEQRLADLKAAKDDLQATFKASAREALKETGTALSEAHHERLGSLVGPFQEKLEGFRQQVAQSHEAGQKERIELRKEIELLARQNQEMAAGAQRLTEALRGSSQTRGEWGEITLLRLLERSGLREGHEYRYQESTTTADGTVLRPDVVIDLPADGCLVVDSKLPLLPWQRVCDADDDGARRIATNDLVKAIRGHMRSLDRKAYSSLYERSVDQVVMYVPIDAALLSALGADGELYDEAYQRGVIITGPTMLMSLLGALAHQWRSVRQERNILRIAKAGESMAEQVQRVAASLSQVGDRLRQGQQAYDKTLRQLATGKGNLLRRTQQLGELGIKAAKQLQVDWDQVDAADSDDGAGAPMTDEDAEPDSAEPDRD
jgi:DNA recombination protein RmuC